MPELLNIEEPSVSRRFLVWVEKTEDEDWGELSDSIDNRPFSPNRVCVVVSQSDNVFLVDWSQAREYHEGDGWTRVTGVRSFGSGRDDDAFYKMPVWMREVHQFAVKSVKEEFNG